MARPNETGNGRDQRGFKYEVSYQPDWFKQLLVTRTNESGAETTVTVFANPEEAKEKKPKKATTRVTSDEGVDFTLDIEAKGTVKAVTVEYAVPPEGGKGSGDGDEEEVVTLTIEDDMPPPSGPGGGGG